MLGLLEEGSLHAVGSMTKSCNIWWGFFFIQMLKEVAFCAI